MQYVIKITLLALAFLTLTSCLEEPKTKNEPVQSDVDYEKVIDTIVGPETIDPDAIKIGDKDVMVESMRIANSMTRERFRREITVLDVKKENNQTKYSFQVKYIQRDNQGNPQDPVTVLRTLVLAVSADGYYQFYGDGDEYTVFSWDFLVGLRGFCSSFETDTSYVTMSCSSIQVEPAVYGASAIPVKKLSLNRAFEIRSKETGAIDKGKLRYVIQIAPQVQEISKVLSFCVEGLQKFDNSVYQLVNCNNVESF
jgi:hypothetical protein